jgi:uncharacterized membrane protein YqjE
MSVPESVGPGASPGLFSSLRTFWSMLIAILYTRLDLATSELEEVGAHAVQLVVVSLAALLCISTAFFFAMFFFLALFWDTQYRLLVLGSIFGIYFLASVVFVLIARHLILHRPKFLSQTLAELRRDVEGLRRAAKTGETKS